MRTICYSLRRFSLKIKRKLFKNCFWNQKSSKNSSTLIERSQISIEKMKTTEAKCILKRKLMGAYEKNCWKMFLKSVTSFVKSQVWFWTNQLQSIKQVASSELTIKTKARRSVDCKINENFNFAASEFRAFEVVNSIRAFAIKLIC